MSNKAKYYLFYIVASLIYIIGTLKGPIAPNRFNLTPAKTHVIQVAIALPVIAIWGVAVYGVTRLKLYTQKIKSDADGKALDIIANGLLVLVFSYLITGAYGVFRAWAFRDGWLPTQTIISNYLAVILSLVAFSLMFRGSLALRRVAKADSKPVLGAASVTFIMALVAAIYIVVLFNYQYLTHTPDSNRYSSFYLDSWVVLVSIAIPYLLSWAMALLACVNISIYQRQVKGIIYRSMIYRLVVGIFAVVVSSILIQMLIAFSTFFAKAGLGSIILIVYLILLLYAAGYVIIASGTRKLSRIEKVK